MWAALFGMLGALFAVVGASGSDKDEEKPETSVENTSPQTVVPQPMEDPDPEDDVEPESSVQTVSEIKPAVTVAPEKPVKPVADEEQNVVVEAIEPADEIKPVSEVTPSDTIESVVQDAEPAEDNVTVEPASSGDPTPPAALEPTVVAKAQDVDVDGGRTTTLEVEADSEIASIKILQGPDAGNLTVNADNTLALVMSGSDYSGELTATYEVTFTDGTTETNTLNLNVSAPAQELGWGQGQHYMLAEDENGDVIVETGEVHRAVYVTESDDGLSREDIAALEGMEVDDVTHWWLKGHPEYGGSEDMALKADIGMELWEGITNGIHNGPNSHWLLFENGYTYGGMKNLVTRGSTGEDELHPMHITSWGDGEQAVITDNLIMVKDVGSNIVFSDLTLAGKKVILDGDNLLFEDVNFTEEELSIQNVDGVTLHDSAVHGVVRDEPTGDDWSAFADRISGLYGSNINGFLIDGSVFHHNAWADDYLEDDGGQPPSMFSHNIYLQFNTYDVTFTDNIVSQGASYGAQFRGGVFAEDNVFVDNNAAVSFLGGDYKDAGPIGNFTFFSDNVVTSGGHHDANLIGALTWGIVNDAVDSTLLDNIVAHLANPNDLEEMNERTTGQPGLILEQDAFYENTILHGWHTMFQQDQSINTDGLNQATLDQTTIQNFAAAVLGDPNSSIEDLMEYILALPASEFDEHVSAEAIVRYFQEGFGLADSNTNQTTHVFTPNDLGDGIRWDNDINWSTDQAPDKGDSVDLNGNWVQYGGTLKLENLDLGDGGQLHVNYGKLTIDGALDAGDTSGLIDIDGAGQFWLNGLDTDSSINFDIDGGRFANTGNFTGEANFDISDGDAILATNDAMMALTGDSELRLDGSDARVGFDGDAEGVAILQMTDDSTLSMIGDDEGFASIEEFRSGAFGHDTADVLSGVSLDGTLQLDLSAQTEAGTHTLISVDALHGQFDEIDVFGLSDSLDAQLVFDYDADTLTLNLTNGSGIADFTMIGDADDGTSENADLWAALTQGHGVFDDTPTDIDVEDGAVPEMAML